MALRTSSPQASSTDVASALLIAEMTTYVLTAPIDGVSCPRRPIQINRANQRTVALSLSILPHYPF